MIDEVVATLLILLMAIVAISCVWGIVLCNRIEQLEGYVKRLQRELDESAGRSRASRDQ